MTMKCSNVMNCDTMYKIRMKLEQQWKKAAQVRKNYYKIHF